VIENTVTPGRYGHTDEHVNTFFLNKTLAAIVGDDETAKTLDSDMRAHLNLPNRKTVPDRFERLLKGSYITRPNEQVMKTIVRQFATRMAAVLSTEDAEDLGKVKREFQRI